MIIAVKVSAREMSFAAGSTAAPPTEPCGAIADTIPLRSITAPKYLMRRLSVIRHPLGGVRGCGRHMGTDVRRIDVVTDDAAI